MDFGIVDSDFLKESAGFERVLSEAARVLARSDPGSVQNFQMPKSESQTSDSSVEATIA